MKQTKIDKVPDSTLASLYKRASAVVEQARDTAYRQVNEALVKRNWEFSRRLKVAFGKEFTKTNLYSFTNLYEIFPEIFHAVSGKSPVLRHTISVLYISSNSSNPR